MIKDTQIFWTISERDRLPNFTETKRAVYLYFGQNRQFFNQPQVRLLVSVYIRTDDYIKMKWIIVSLAAILMSAGTATYYLYGNKVFSVLIFHNPFYTAVCIQLFYLQQPTGINSRFIY